MDYRINKYAVVRNSNCMQNIILPSLNVLGRISMVPAGYFVINGESWRLGTSLLRVPRQMIFNILVISKVRTSEKSQLSSNPAAP